MSATPSTASPSTSHSDHHTCQSCGSKVIDPTAQADLLSNVSSQSDTGPIGSTESSASSQHSSAVEELRLLKAQVQDATRVCNAIVRGDLTQKITNVESVSSEMSSLVVTINDMVDQLSSFSGEVKKVAQDIRTEGNLNVRVEIGNAQGIWQETALSVNTMVSHLMIQVGAFNQIIHAAGDGDFTRFLTVDASGEMDTLKSHINNLVFNLRDSIQRVTANRKRCELVVNKSQELRTPLDEIIKTTDLTLASDLNQPQRESLLHVQSLARALLRITDDIQDTSMLKAENETRVAATGPDMSNA